MSRTLGLIRDLSAKYAIVKQKVNDNKYILKDSFTSSEKGFVSNTADKNAKGNFIPKFSNQTRTELTSWHLPPKYVEQFQKCNDIFDTLEIQLGKLQQEQQKRITPKFNENENQQLDNNINLISLEINNNLKQIDKCINDLQHDITLNSPHEKQIKDNMRQYLLSNLASFTKKFKTHQENYYYKYTEINKGEDNINSVKQGNVFMQENINKNNILEQRNKEMNSLLKSINELSEMFKEVEKMVFQQGTILDRIDYNINLIQDNSQKAHMQIIKADNKMKSSCARKANMTLLLIDLIMGIIIIFKLF